MVGNEVAKKANEKMMYERPQEWRKPIMGLLEDPSKPSIRKQTRGLLKSKYREKSWR